ncbi:hypothetical protein BT67DRAFT_318430 [Trichocladium antarcticum]|uniref:Altered inheritance of mitochondria protein 41 n=1 Tax=Trichocladium antarcticum TaxID=1450529 RepID=A0AAN6UJZ6_9PEZI|nr:hypothetical protein BT67DRAFT_318430 [Trichocladium antarcticum]
MSGDMASNPMRWMENAPWKLEPGDLSDASASGWRSCAVTSQRLPLYISVLYARLKDRGTESANRRSQSGSAVPTGFAFRVDLREVRTVHCFTPDPRRIFHASTLHAPSTMATKLCPSLLRSFGRPSLRQAANVRVFRAAYSTDTPPPPLLAKIKTDLKAAMRAKDANRLAVLRSMIAATLNASKTDKPIQTDAQLVNLLHKTKRQSQEVVEEARAAGREDIIEKEEAQQRIMDEYAGSSGVKEIGEAELRQIIQTAKAGLVAEGIEERLLSGRLMKQLLSPGGPLDGAMVDKKEVARIVMEVAKAN